MCGYAKWRVLRLGGIGRGYVAKAEEEEAEGVWRSA